jgi:hypothetical protein
VKDTYLKPHQGDYRKYGIVCDHHVAGICDSLIQYLKSLVHVINVFGACLVACKSV